MKKMSKGDVMSGIFGAMIMGSPIYADGLENMLNSLSSYLLTRVGPGLVLVSIAIGAAFLVFGNRSGVQKCIYGLVGGVVMTLATWIYSTVVGWAR